MVLNQSRNATQKPRISTISRDILDDLASRFIINFREKDDLIQICPQLELAHWFYLDEYVLEESKASAYNLKNVK